MRKEPIVRKTKKLPEADVIKQTPVYSFPVIGIGAGVNCDGQVLVLHDMLDIGILKRPRFSKNFMQEATTIESAIDAYHQAVKQSRFPTTEHSF